MKKVPPSVRLKEEVEKVLRGEGLEEAPAEPPMQGFVRALARYILQVSIEEEATTFLGRGHYRRGQRVRAGWRNGYEAKRVQTEAGLLDLAVPQLRASSEPFRPALVERLGRRTPDLEALVRGMYVRGLSTQDVSDLYGEAFGASRLSKSTVSRISQQLTQEFDRWRKRDLSELPVVYLFLDGQYHAARQGSDEKEGVLSAYALLEDGQPVLLHLDLGPRESYDAWLSFLQDMTARGLKDPLLVILDGAPGLLKAVKREVSGAQDAQHPGETSTADAGLDEALASAGVSGAELRGGPAARPCSDRSLPRSLSCGDRVLGTGPGGMRDLPAISRGASPADSNDESVRAIERGESPAHQSDSTLSHRAILSHVALCELGDRIEALEGRAHDAEDREAASGTAST